MDRTLADLDAVIHRTADEARFSGVVGVDLGRESEGRRQWAFGLADRRHRVPITPATRFGIASGTKGFTALTVMSLVESGELTLDTRVRDLLGDDLPLVDDGVTVEHLLTHRSGIGDYLDESEQHDINDHVLPVPAHELWTTERYVAILDGHRQVSAPGERFAYNNSGYVLLAVVAGRAGGRPFEELVHRRVCAPAGLSRTSFEPSDQLPPDVALGYLADDGLRTNVFHLPVLGSGDGGIVSTEDDIRRLWSALFDGTIVSAGTAQAMTAAHSVAPEQSMRYGMGFWLAAEGPVVVLEGYDAGVSFRTSHDPSTGATLTVLSNTARGAWPLARAIGA